MPLLQHFTVNQIIPDSELRTVPIDVTINRQTDQTYLQLYGKIEPHNTPDIDLNDQQNSYVSITLWQNVAAGKNY